MKRKCKLVHPCRILHDEFMEPAGLSRHEFAETTGLSRRQLDKLVDGENAITAAVALQLERSLGMSAQTWMNLQLLYDRELAAA